jgi:hypothetical protein
MKNPSSRAPIPFTFIPPSPFAIPAGCYRAVLREVFACEDDEGDPVVRFVLDITRGENGPVRYSAALEYLDDKKWHAKLNQDLTAFLPQDEIDQMLGMPADVDLTSFVGDEADLMISTFTGSDHPPYSRVTGVYPAGSLIKGEALAMGETDAVSTTARSRSP